jgi:hypothetical protein
MANQAVYGIVAKRANAEKIIQALVDVGVNPVDVSLLASQGQEFHEFGSLDVNRDWRTEERVTDYPSDTVMPERNMGRNVRGRSSSVEGDQGGLGTEAHTKAPEGATTGGVTGGIIGGTLGLLAGIGALAIPGLGPFIAAGPLMATLAGIGTGGTLGGLIGALAGLGMPEFEAKRYENRLREGGVLLAVRANNDDFAKRIKDIMQQHGAEDVSISSEASTSKRYNK